ncbi:fibronectin type III domain-containing protein [Actinocrinis puniceicyclus]|uniref:alpha-amylase n=1 Tax=Actinocrinis puniceicyclus TaxID=977794 RepID=A0A8J7WPE9_9ACTN|nr:fibronectin type III domain-containing protein [Actinocrinis puniceicyclus]MBS2966226.1 fibronectin type III domain-containing protein [Actinocrinis puniceicyclus]
MRRFLVGSVVVSTLVAGFAAWAPPARAASIDPSAVTASVQGLNVAVSWADGDTAGVTGYTVSTVPQSPVVTVPPGATSAVLTGTRPGISYTVQVAAQTGAGAGTQVAAPSPVTTHAPGGSYVALNPARLLDTRIGLGAPAGVTQLVSLTVTGRGGVPATGVSAVALNVTVTTPQGGGYLTAYPAGVSRPLASNVNFIAGQNQANLVVVRVGTGGQVELYSSAPAQLVADVSGYYTTAAAASPSTGLYHALPPSRLLDTRDGTGVPAGAVGTGQSINLQVTGVGGVPATGVSAVVLNTTVTAPTTGGYVTVYPAGTTRPTTSTLNFTANEIVANRVVVRVGKGGMVSLYNYYGNTHLVADVTGWYTDGSDASAGGSYYVALPPYRLVDTRYGTGAPKAPIGPGGVLPAQVAGVDGVPAASSSMPATGAALTVTEAGNTIGMYATVYPSLAARPLASDLNAPLGRVMANLTLGALGVDGAVDVYNYSGDTEFIVDLSGYFIGDVHIPSSTVTPAPGAVTSVTQGSDGPSSVTIAAGNPAPGIGQVIAAGSSAAAPGGVLGQVTSVSTDSAGASVAALQPATLQQALGNADIALNVPLGAADVVTTQTSARSAPQATGGGSGGYSGVVDEAQLRARVTARDSGTPINASGGGACSGDHGSTVAVTASFTTALVFEAHLGHRGFVPTLSAKAGIDIAEQLGASVAYTGSVACQWSAQLAKYTFRPVEFAVGDVPVVIVPVFTLTMRGSAQGSAEVSASISQSVHAQAGIAYQDNSVTPYQGLSNSVSHTEPGITAANADVSVAVTGDLEGKLYGIAGPEAALTVTLAAHADVTASPWWQLTLSIDADAALHIRILIFHLDLSQSFNLASFVLAQAAGAATSSPPVIVTTSLPDAVTGQSYSTQLTTADHRTGSWSVVSGSLPAGLHLSGYTVSGTPTTAGTAHFTLGFTDTTGHSVQAAATLTVDQGSTPSTGALSGRVTDSRGDPLAAVSVQLYQCSPYCVSGPINFASTAADGTYSFTGVATGTGYVVCFDGSNATGGVSDATGYVFTCYGYSATNNQATRLTVNGGLTTTGVGAWLVTGGAVSGHVTDSGGHALANDAFGGALTYSMGGLLPDPTRTPTAYTDGSGNYRIKGIDQNYYAICFEGDVYPVGPGNTGYGSNCYGNLAVSVSMNNAIPVTAGETDTGIGIALGPGAALSGRVTDKSGNALENVTVYVSGQSAVNSTNPAYDSDYYVADTAPDGTYVVGNLTPGTDYDVCFDGTYATGAASAPYGYAFGCYNGASGYNDATLVPLTTAGQYLTGINGSLAANTSPPATLTAGVRSRLAPPAGPGAKRTVVLPAPPVKRR